jgi:hypothetical protein
MKKLLFAIVILIAMVLPCAAKSKWVGYVSKGGKFVRVSTTISYRLMETYPGATVTVYLTGTTNLATIYSDNAGTVKSNPFTADSNAKYEFYVDNGKYDIKFSGTGIVVPFTFSDLAFFDKLENLASETNIGETKLSVAPADPANPVAVGTNDLKLIGLPVTNERINIKDYPYLAVCDGVANDSGSISLAIDAAKVSGKPKVIKFPEGTCKVGSNITKSFDSTFDVIFEGTGSGSVLLLATGASTNAFTFANGYSLVFKDLTIAGTGPSTNPIPDAKTGFKFTNFQKILWENTRCYGVYAPESLIYAESSDLFVTTSSFRGCAASSGTGFGLIKAQNWKGVTITHNHFVDFGDLNGGGFLSKTGISTTEAWVTINKPNQEIIEEIIGTNVPIGANAFAQGQVLIEHNKFDEGALAAVRVTSNTGIGEPLTARVRISGNDMNIASVPSAFGYYIQNTRNLQFEQEYGGYAYGTDVLALYLDNVGSAELRGGFAEQRAGTLYIRSTPYLELKNYHYKSLDTDGNSRIKILQEGKESNKVWAAGIYTYAQLTPASSVSEVLQTPAILDFDLTAVVYQDLTVPLVGAIVGNNVNVAPPAGSMVDTDYSAWVSASDVVTVRAKRLTGTPNPPSGAFNITVTKY